MAFPNLSTLGFVLRIACDSGMSDDECRAVAEACGQVRESEACKVGSPSHAPDERGATLHFEGRDLASLSIEGEHGKEALVRVLRFRPEDSREDRAKALGLTLGVLAEMLEPERVEKLSPPVETHAKSEEKPSPSPPNEGLVERQLSLEGSVFVRYDPSLSSPFLGGRIGVLLHERRPFGLELEATLASSLDAPGNLRLLEGQGLVRLLLRPSPRLPIALAPALGISVLDASVVDSPLHQGRTTLTSELALRIAVLSTEKLSLLVSPALTFTPETTGFSRGSVVLGTTSPFMAGLSLGGTFAP